MSDWTKDRDEAARRMVKTAREAGNTYPGSFGGALEGAVAEIDRLTTELARWTAPIDVDAEVMREADVAWSRHREICDRLGPASSSVWPYVVRPHVEREARLRREVDRLTTELASRTKAATDWRDTAERHLARAEVAERGLAAIRRAAEPEPFEKIEQLPPTPGRFDVPVVQAPPAGSWRAPRCDKGHVARPGAPCPICRRASLEAALHDPETAEGAAAILADMPPPDPRATLHAGDPESGVDGSGVLVPHPANVLASKRGDK